MTDKDKDSETVLVPPAGIHTPGTVAMGGTPLVEVPADHTDEDKTRAALKAAAEGKTTDGPAGIAHQEASGPALPPGEGKRRAEAASPAVEPTAEK